MFIFYRVTTRSSESIKDGFRVSQRSHGTMTEISALHHLLASQLAGYVVP
jgi:hypothetical protein